MCLELKVKKLFNDAKLPVRANPTDSGADVFVYSFEKMFPGCNNSHYIEKSNSIVLYPNNRVLINTGLSVTVGPGYEIQVRPRSGNALNKGLIVVNSPGTIDESYRGMLGVIVANIGQEAQEIKVGDKIAQLVVSQVCLLSIKEVNTLDNTERGNNGFGSTDNK